MKTMPMNQFELTVPNLYLFTDESFPVIQVSSGLVTSGLSELIRLVYLISDGTDLALSLSFV